MIRIVVSSDWHVDWVTAGVERFSDVDAHLESIVDYIEENDVDHFLFGGDAFDPGGSQEAQWSTFMIRAAERIQERIHGSSLWLAGNHDTHNRSPVLTVLSPLRSAGRWASGRVHVVEEPEVVLLESDIGGHEVCVLALPHVARPGVGRLQEGADLDQFIHTATIPLNRDGPDDAPLVVLSHMQLPQMHAGSEGEMDRGRQAFLPVEAIRAIQPAPVAVLNGHYHRPEVVVVDGLEVVVIGAPQRFTFGELDETARGFVVVEIEV